MRLLLVEDDTQLAQTLAKGLREHAYTVDMVRDGDAAVYEASVVPCDAIAGVVHSGSGVRRMKLDDRAGAWSRGCRGKRYQPMRRGYGPAG